MVGKRQIINPLGILRKKNRNIIFLPGSVRYNPQSRNQSSGESGTSRNK